jgi:hypothetical protein
MKHYFANLFISANDQDPASVRLLRIILGVVTVALLGIAVLLLLIHHRVGEGIIGASIIAALSGIGLFLSYRNVHWFGRLFFPLFALAGLTYMAITTDGLHDSTVVGLTLVIIFTGLLSGQAAISLTTALVVSAIWVIAYADIYGINQSLFARSTKENDAIGLAVVISVVQIIAATTLNVLMSRLNQVLESVRRSEYELMENNRELNDIRASLEEKVTERTRAAESARAEAEFQSWYTRGQVQLAEKMRGDLDIPTLAKNVISFLCQYLDAHTGALFLASGDVLKLTGRYAYVEHANRKSEFRLGESLIGEVAKSRQKIKLDAVSNAAPLISSALGEAKPNQILIAPIETEGQVYGVVELATLGEFSQDHEIFLSRVSESIAIAFRTAQARLRINDLLTQSQQQAEELQAQEEELRAANEQLQAQAEKLSNIVRKNKWDIT